jgi:Mn-dependent DtxR family transcriptional regulator
VSKVYPERSLIKAHTDACELDHIRSNNNHKQIDKALIYIINDAHTKPAIETQCEEISKKLN